MLEALLVMVIGMFVVFVFLLVLVGFFKAIWRVPLQRWLEEYIWPIEAACIDESFVYDGTRLAAVEMLRSGVTCFNDMYFHPETTARAAAVAAVALQ